MKKFFIVILILSVIFNVSIVLASSRGIDIDKVEHQLGTVKYDIKIDGVNSNKSINVREFDPEVGDYVSLRAFVEALGGSIEWEPNDLNKDLGKFELLGYKYTMELDSCLSSIHEIPNKYYEYYLPINLYTEVDGKKIVFNMNNWINAISVRFENDTIYINITSLRRLLPKMGYLINFNKDDKSVNLKTYNFDDEKRIVLEKFPIEKFDLSYYSDSYEEYIEDTRDPNIYYCYDIFSKQARSTEDIESRYLKNVAPTYKSMYYCDNPDENFYKELFKGLLTDSENIELSVKYDEDIDAYIIFNKPYDDVSVLDETYKIMAVRKYDNMIMYLHI